jgi:hypothetical protein
LRRQFLTHIHRGHGAVTAEFFRAVLTRGHVIASRLRSHAQVYHLIGKAVYAALGDPDSRNRRRHELSAIRRRLMGFDFVLTRPDWIFFPTERETVRFFVETLRLPPEVLPATAYAQRDGGPGRTMRYFAERYPIAVAADHGVVALVYVDDAERTEAGFEHFLRRYLPLCQHLTTAVEVAFLTAIDGQQPLAEQAFARVVRDGGPHAVTLAGATESELLAYVQARQTWEQGALAGLQQQDLDAIRQRLQRFRDTTADALYRAWRTSGTAALLQFMQDRQSSAGGSRVRLTVHRLPFDYRPFGAWKTEGC